ncbi:hypothetical protein [Paenibacillus sp. LHD-117]
MRVISLSISTTDRLFSSNSCISSGGAVACCSARTGS